MTMNLITESMMRMKFDGKKNLIEFRNGRPIKTILTITLHSMLNWQNVGGRVQESVQLQRAATAALAELAHHSG